MSGEGLAGASFHALIRIAPELLKDGEYARLVDRWGTVAKHMKNPPANVWVRIVGHLEESIPNLRIVDLNFARTQSSNSREPCFGVPVPAEFEQARNF
jgi:hypothetical protein